MMNSQGLRIGDEVFIRNPSDPSNGTKAVVVGFGQVFYGRVDNCGIRPGVYATRDHARIRFENGDERCIGALSLCPADEAKYQRRMADPRLPTRYRLGDLPPTPFWEGDFVRPRGSHSGSISDPPPPLFQIVRINYPWIGSETPPYQISESLLASGWSVQAGEREIELVERGPVWRFYHGERDLYLDSLGDRARFFELLGRTEEVPSGPLDFLWSKGRAIEAVRRGLGHGFRRADFPDTFKVILFKDEELGQEVAKATLQGRNPLRPERAYMVS